QGVTLPSPEALERFQIGNLVGKSPKMQEIYKLIGLLTMSDTTVLIKGESGAGKELVAKAIHFNSSRSSRPFVAINCTALQDTLLESELFGYEKGAFTGAASRTVGKFDLAHGGTLFFDEVGDMSPALQGKVLRVLQEKNFYRVGGRESISVDARIIAATHRDLEVEVREGRFREDLYYRLNVVSVNIPPLRERGEDIPYLVSHFLMRMRGELGRDITGVEDKVMDAFMKYPWPGNVRELENVLRRAAVLTRGSFISMEYLPEAFQGRSRLSDPFAELDQVIQKIFLQSASDESQGGSLFSSAIQQVERSLILAALEYSKWNQVKASKLLGINRGTLRKKMIEYNITPLGPEDEHSAPTDD
ncbi:MAG TPA: sigma-54 dependent transcriptional regulator, partial [Nitrospirota bacterium]|nr:sigma-54 dependent transcriptional regulator [Nitrospirota bacterium]